MIFPTESTEESAFKATVEHLHAIGRFPSPTEINKALGFIRARMNVLSGREVGWRTEVFRELGYTKGTNGRWTR